MVYLKRGRSRHGSEMGLMDLETGCRRPARDSREKIMLQQTSSVGGGRRHGNLLGLWTQARVEAQRGSAEKEARRIKDSEPLASGQGVRASSLQQQPEQIIARRPPQRQWQKTRVGALGRRTSQGVGFQSANLIFVARKVVLVAWWEATESTKCSQKVHGRAMLRSQAWHAGW